jgi:hypothetical protein
MFDSITKGSEKVEQGAAHAAEPLLKSLDDYIQQTIYGNHQCGVVQRSNNDHLQKHGLLPEVSIHPLPLELIEGKNIHGKPALGWEDTTTERVYMTQPDRYGYPARPVHNAQSRPLQATDKPV